MGFISFSTLKRGCVKENVYVPQAIHLHSSSFSTLILRLQWPWKDTAGTQEGTAQCLNSVGNARFVFVLKQRKLRLCFVLFINEI